MKALQEKKQKEQEEVRVREEKERKRKEKLKAKLGVDNVGSKFKMYADPKDEPENALPPLP